MPHTSLLENFSFDRAQSNFPNVQWISPSLHHAQRAVGFILISLGFELLMRWALSKKQLLRNATLRYGLEFPSSVLGRTCLMLSGLRVPFIAHRAQSLLPVAQTESQSKIKISLFQRRRLARICPYGWFWVGWLSGVCGRGVLSCCYGCFAVK